jgi:hypothetical protein
MILATTICRALKVFTSPPSSRAWCLQWLTKMRGGGSLILCPFSQHRHDLTHSIHNVQISMTYLLYKVYRVSTRKPIVVKNLDAIAASCQVYLPGKYLETGYPSSPPRRSSVPLCHQKSLHRSFPLIHSNLHHSQNIWLFPRAAKVYGRGSVSSVRLNPRQEGETEKGCHQEESSWGRSGTRRWGPDVTLRPETSRRVV